jgi:signal transduction histidine kinase
MAWADPGWTATILDNLINNGLVHTGESPRVVVEVDGSRPTSIWVTDAGPGIPEEATARIFERFFRVANGSDVPGSGLGLYLSRQLARLQGGDLELESNDDGGARFRLDLQAEPAARRTPA